MQVMNTLIKIQRSIFQHDKEDLEIEHLLLFYWSELEGGTEDKLINKHGIKSCCLYLG